MGNPVIKNIQNYRKTIVSRCQSLTYLDDRPVFEKERLLCNAWAVGGLDGERAERERIRNEEQMKQKANFEGNLHIDGSHEIITRAGSRKTVGDVWSRRGNEINTRI
jgi:hypothetical protein